MASSSKKVILAALIGNGLISITKFIAAGITGSAAMFSEGIHSLVDTGNQVLLLLGLRRAAKPADERFPFGYGKEIYFWSFVVAILIFGVGAGVSIFEGIESLRHPHEVTNPMVNYIVLGLAMVFEGFAWYFAFKAFKVAKGELGYFKAVKGGKDPSLFVVLFEDSAAMVGLVIAFLGVWLTQLTGLLWLDGLASVLIGLVLAGTAAWLAHETKGLLIGEAAEPHLVAGIRELAAERPAIDSVYEVLTMHVGPEFVLVNLSVKFQGGTVAERIERSIAELDQEIKARFPRVKRVFVEAESRSRTQPSAGADL